MEGKKFKAVVDTVRNMYAPKTEATMMKDDGVVVHNCAKHVEHAVWGQGNCIAEEHADPDRHGNIAWYDIEFKHGIETGVPVSELKILAAESHGHSSKKAKKMSEEVEATDLELDLTQTELDEIAEAYMGMEKLKSKLASKGAKNPAGLAAYIGRKKYGKEKFQAAAAAGKKLGK